MNGLITIATMVVSLMERIEMMLAQIIITEVALLDCLFDCRCFGIKDLCYCSFVGAINARTRCGFWTDKLLVCHSKMVLR